MGNSGEPLPTKATLLERVKDTADQASWKEFHDLYRPLVLAVARREGLSDDDADDVAQETFSALVDALPSYSYDPQRASFKSWLRTVINHRVMDYFRQRDGRTQARAGVIVRERPSGVEPVANLEPGSSDDAFEEEWRRTIMLHALAELKKQVTTATYQVTYLLLHGKTPTEVAAALRISRGSVYLAKHRAGPKLRRLVKELEAKYG